MIEPRLTLPGVEVYIGDALDTVLRLAKKYVGKINTVITSPPYFNLRDYGTASWEGGDPTCDHGIKRQHGSAKVVDAAQSGHAAKENKLNRKVCKCGAIRVDKQIGLEDSVEEYVNRLADLFDAIGEHLLRPDGSLWINLGDSYAGSGGAGGDYNPGGLREGQPKWKPPKTEWPAKSLMMVPERFALEMIRRGWILRNRVIWFKGKDVDEILDDEDGRAPASNGMPVSAEDRLKGTYEVVFHFVRQQRYFYDLDAIREAHTTNEEVTPWQDKEYDQHFLAAQQANGVKGRPKGVAGYSSFGRNPGDMWAIPTAQFPLAHFATFPPALVHRPVKATCPEAICRQCGKPRILVYEPTGVIQKRELTHTPNHKSSKVDSTGWALTKRSTGMYAPSCTCNKQGIEFEPDDLEVIESPTGGRSEMDPSLVTGRAGFNRPRGDNEGMRPMTRYEQRRYAEQLRRSPRRADMEQEAGTAFAHYIRKDRSGARPIPLELLVAWLERGWLMRVAVPEFEPCGWTGGIVLDPFGGSGATAQGAFEARPPKVIDGHTCQPKVILIDLDERNIPIIEKRLTGRAKQSRKPDLSKYGGGLFKDEGVAAT